MAWYEILIVALLILTAVGCWCLIRINHPQTDEEEMEKRDQEFRELCEQSERAHAEKEWEK